MPPGSPRKSTLQESESKTPSLLTPFSSKTMSLPIIQPESGFVPSDELREQMPLSEVLEGTSFVSPSGRVYRLFGNEEKAFAMPDIPAFSPVLTAQKSPAFSLEDALLQIETFSLPETNENATEQPQPSLSFRTVEHVSRTETPSMLQLYQALEESPVPDRQVDIGIPLKLVNSENAAHPVNVTLSVKDFVREVSQVLPAVSTAPSAKPNEEKRKTLRLVSDLIEEPFIVPFAKPVSLPDDTETTSTPLKVVTECVPPTLSPVVLRTGGLRRRSERALYRKQFSIPPVSAAQTEELPVIIEQKPPVDTSTFQWSAQINALMQTAGNQIRMLTDHLVVQLSQGINTICFKSVFPEDGCSTVLLCAVRAMMERNYRILLIDAHHRHIDLPMQLNLSGNMETGGEVVTVNDRLDLWIWQESRTAAENTALIAEIVATHRESYDVILLDDGSVTESPLTVFAAFWNQIELGGVVLVTNTKRPTEMPLSHIAGRLRQYHIPLIGIAENYV